jgi:hypothetical protein
MFSWSSGLLSEVNCLIFLTICIKDIHFSKQSNKAGSKKKAVCCGLPEKIRGARVVMKTRERALLVR